MGKSAPHRSSEDLSADSGWRLGNGRPLPDLLFVLPPNDRLGGRLGKDEALEVHRMIDRAGKRKVILSRSDLPFEEARAEVLARVLPETQGIVVIGGFDLVPAECLDLLEPDFRAGLPRTENDEPFDPDDFVIWSDDGYGDITGDGLPDLPVSRIPDGQRGQVVLNALTAGERPKVEFRGGLANALRPYAAEIFKRLPGSGEIFFSEPETSADIPPALSAADFQYFVLHGDCDAPHRYLGERRAPRQGFLKAFEISNVGEARDAVVFSACCYSGLSVRTPALFWKPGQPIATVPANGSIALAFLRAGARAFIGTTGVHWSPPMKGDPMQAGAPMHALFMGYLLGQDGSRRSEPPAAALRLAKLAYGDRRPWFRSEDPETVRSPVDEAIELKHIFQFTCLGLGW